MPDGDLEQRSEEKGKTIRIDLTPAANSAIEGLRRLTRQTTADYTRWCFNVGAKIVQTYELEGRAYTEDKNGKKTPIPLPDPSQEFLESETFPYTCPVCGTDYQFKIRDPIICNVCGYDQRQ